MTFPWLAAVIVAVPACAAAPATPTANPAPFAQPALPVAFGALFHTGATWRFGAVTCRIERAGEVVGGWRSSLRCTGSPIASRVDHDFAATPSGLWSVELGWEGDPRTLPADTMVMAADPKPIMRPTIEDPNYPTGRLYELRAHHGAWCMSELQSSNGCAANRSDFA